MAESLAIGIDLGGTQLRAGLVDQSGHVLRRVAEPTDNSAGPPSVIAQIVRLAGEVTPAEARDAIVGCGVSSPGPLDSDTGLVLSLSNLPGWHDVPLRQLLADAFRLPVRLENDGIAAAYGEWTAGAGQGTRNMVYVTVSTGIGGGVVADGRLLRGRRGMACHAGHLIMAPDGPRCGCGAVGCFEAVASGKALGEAGREAARMHPGSLLAAHPAEGITAKSVAEAARLGDPVAIGLLDREADLLGTGFTSLLHLFSPERLIMGGGVSTAFDLLERRIRKVVSEMAMPPYRDVVILPASLGDNAGVIGAAGLIQAQLAGRQD